MIFTRGENEWSKTRNIYEKFSLKKGSDDLVISFTGNFFDLGSL